MPTTYVTRYEEKKSYLQNSAPLLNYGKSIELVNYGKALLGNVTA